MTTPLYEVAKGVDRFAKSPAGRAQRVKELFAQADNLRPSPMHIITVYLRENVVLCGGYQEFMDPCLTLSRSEPGSPAVLSTIPRYCGYPVCPGCAEVFAELNIGPIQFYNVAPLPHRGNPPPPERPPAPPVRRSWIMRLVDWWHDTTP